jgi:hypothetical protein
VGWRMNIEAADATEDYVDALLRLNRRRSEAFGAELFGNPGWDLLLQLFAAKLGGRKTRLEDLAPIGPRSTLARWASVLQDRGLVSCQLGRLDSGDLWIELSVVGAAKMSGLLEGLRRSHPDRRPLCEEQWR